MNDYKIREAFDIDSAKEYIKEIIGCDFYNYIDKRLAGDFAVELAVKYKSASAEMEKLREKIESMKCCGNCRHYHSNALSTMIDCRRCIINAGLSERKEDYWQAKEGK